MTGPFRDDLENAHARNAQLEAENARLKGELEATRPPTVNKPTGIPWSFVAFLGVLALSLVAMVSIALAPRAQPSDRQFPGVAIAPPPPVPAPRPVAVFSPPSTSPSCTCADGDPLCECAKAEPPPSPGWQPIVPHGVFELGASDRPADWQRAREILESRVYNKRGTRGEIRLLKAICKKQGDRTCVEVCQGLDVARPAEDPALHL